MCLGIVDGTRATGMLAGKEVGIGITDGFKPDGLLGRSGLYGLCLRQPQFGQRSQALIGGHPRHRDKGFNAIR